ncbi:MAG: SIMPL domain-containing protein [Planctomycetota bacterium]
MRLIQRFKIRQSEFIAVKGSAEIAVVPESLRLVFSVTAESAASKECSVQTAQTIAAIRKQLAEIGVNDQNVVEDFIVMLPTYDWELKKSGDTEYLEERLTGYRMQTNLHVLCKNELEANQIMKVAFTNGVNEIISFDYWHSKLEEYKQQAINNALQAAQEKSEILLSVFPEKPLVMNIDHSASVSFPQSRYKTIQPKPSNDNSIVPYRWKNFLKIRAHRPLTTYYAGSNNFADVTTAKPPMNPEIMVYSEVTLTYGSPTRVQRMELERAIGQSKN